MGCTITFYPFLKGDDIHSFIENGALEGAVMGDMPALISAAGGRIAVISLFNKGSVSLVSRDVYRVRDLKGKKVAYPHGSNAHYYLLRLLKEKEMSETDIRRVPMDTPEMFDAIDQKRIDAFTTFEPTASVFIEIDPTLHTISRSFSSYDFFILRKDYAARHPRAARALAAAQFRAMAWLAESGRNVHRASRWVAEVSEKLISLPLDKHLDELDELCSEDLLNNITDYFTVLDRDVLGDNGDIRAEFEFLKRKGFIPSNREWIDVRDSIDTRNLRETLKGLRPAAARVRP
jgi:ABC-type nitrate/sulfonate/bicarbonate transport system substrate-binding protein